MGLNEAQTMSLGEMRRAEAYAPLIARGYEFRTNCINRPHVLQMLKDSYGRDGFDVVVREDAYDMSDGQRMGCMKAFLTRKREAQPDTDETEF